MMSYAEALSFLYEQLPMFQRIGAAAYKDNLDNTIALCRARGNPERGFKSVHVAGTNGKGSISSALASIFMENGYTTGLFTSPHLKDFRERIRVNGEMIPEQDVVRLLGEYKDLIAQLKPSFFELTCCMAFDYFREKKVDIAILEVGMGGRLDSTNVVVPELAIITSIGMDHQQFLGDTLEKIAAEKGGIIKGGVPLIVSENDAVVIEVLKDMALKKSAPAVFVTDDMPGFQTDLTGIFQGENMRTVHAAIDVLRQRGWSLQDEKVKLGAIHVKRNTGLRGRWELLSERPRVIADVGHNEEGVAMVVEMLKKEKYKNLRIVWGMVSDKDASKILALLPAHATYYWCRPDVPRGKDVELLKTEGMAFNLNGDAYPSVTKALEDAKKNAETDDLIFLGGSVFVVGEAL